MGKIIRRYQKPHDEGQGGTNIITYNVNVGGASSDGNFTTIRANRADIDEIHAKNIDAENINATVHLMASDGTIQHISGQDLEYMTGRINTLSTSNLTVDEQATIKNADIKNLIADYINAKKIDTVDLTVTGTAHFFELIIDKINSVEGTIINTAAHCKADYVEQVDENGNTRSDYADEHEGDDTGFTPTRYRIYWRKDQDGAARTNNWLEHDQAISKSFNKATVGTNYNISNTNYWRLVVGKNLEGDRTWINFDTGKKRYTEPDDKIHFLGFSWSRPQDENVYADTQADWTVTGQGQTLGLWTPDETDEQIDTSGAGKLLAQQTLLGIEIIPTPDETEPPLVKWGTFSFETEKPCKINVGFLYDDGTVEYFPAEDYETSYNFELTYDAAVERIIITAATIEQWNECWWIDLSDSYDSNNPLESGKTENSTVPQVGDVISQLGYRYQYLDGYVNTDEWRENHSTAVARASAIIIAAYETPDTGLYESGEWVKAPIEPPSYAQYMDITTFELARYRKTYMDATGAYVMGKLVSESGTEIDIDDELTVDTEYYQIISNENPIIKQASDHDVEFTVLHVKNGVGNILTAADLTNFNMKVNNSSIGRGQNDNYFTYTVIGNSSGQLDITLYYNSTLKDEILLSIVDLGTVTNGKDGTEYELKYKNAQTKPSDNEDRTAANNWYDTATTPDFAHGYYTWMSQRNTYYDNLGNKTWTDWTQAIRITGDNGQPGEDGLPGADGADGKDGSFTEFIFAVNNDIDNAPNIINTYDGTSQQYVVTDENDNIIRWYDADAVIWRQRITAVGAYVPDYIPPSQLISTSQMRTIWKDDPIGPDATNKYEWVSTRKYDGPTKTFTDFTTPVIWAIYAEDGQDGTNGTNGQDGNDGTDGQEDTINLLRGIFEVRINANSYDTVTKYENIKGELYTDIIVAVKHTDGTDAEYIEDLRDYSLALATDNTAGNNAFTSAATVNITTNGNDSDSQSTYKALRFNNTNLLKLINTSSTELQDYYYLHKHGLTARMPTKIFIKLMKGNEIIDTTSIDLKFKASHIFSVGETQLNSIYQGLSGLTGVSWTTGFSQIHQDWQNINLSVNNIKKTSALQYPEDNETQKYAWLVDVKTSNPSAPTDSIITYTYAAPHGYWSTSHDTSYNGVEYLDSTYNGHFMSNKTRDSYFGNDGTLQYTNWTNWSKPTLYATFEDGVGTTVNSAQLDIKADQITSTVSATYLRKDATGVYVTQSQLTQTATGIYAHVTSDIDGKLNDTGIDIETGIITLDADNTLFTGDVQVKGDIEAGIYKGLTYTDSYTSTGLQNALKTYNSGTILSYSNYIFTGNWTSGFRYIELPPADEVEGMELNIYRYAENNNYGKLRVSILSSDNVVLPSNNSGVFSPNFIEMSTKRLYTYSYNDIIYDGVVTHLDSSYTPFYVLAPGQNQADYATNYMIENKDTSNHSFGGNRYVQILNNNLTTFKAMDGAWYLTRGIVTASGSN